MSKSFPGKIKAAKTEEKLIAVLGEWLDDWRDQQKRLATIGLSNVAYGDLQNLYGTTRKLKTLTDLRHNTLPIAVDILIAKLGNPDAVKIDLESCTAPQEKIERQLRKEVNTHGLSHRDDLRHMLLALLDLADIRHDILRAQLYALAYNIGMPHSNSVPASSLTEPDSPAEKPSVKVTVKKRFKKS